ncbi:GroES-like protein [Meredithblackwellia eburnea MCA 4105]
MSSPNIPDVCKAVVCKNPGKGYTLELVEDYPVPKPKAGELLLKINCTGLCASDHHGMLEDIGRPMTCACAGHEGAGVVVAVGEGVDPSQWKVGDRGGVKPAFDVCHECDSCRGGNELSCAKMIGTGGSVDGSFCEYIVTPARYTTRIPEGVPDEIAAPMMCSGSTIYTAIKRSGVRAGQWLVLPGGGGGVGHLGIAFGKVMGVRVIVIDSGEEKKKLAEEMGCEAFIDFKTCPDAVGKVKEITGGGAHAVIVTGANAAAYSTAPHFLRPGGVQVCVGLPPFGTVVAGADPCLIIFLRLTIKGSLVGGMEDVDEALAMVARGLVKPRVTVKPFAQFKEAFAQLVAANVAGRLVIDFNA